ncbi:MAG: LysR family transcriptional regulator [Novosphingobium sp.]|nr:LysR family transcriptional regulator [Novosphingobium sp.]
MQFDLVRLRYIVAVSRIRSFSRAAEELRISQPALSRSIADFEERFGVRLFDRGRGGVVVTAIGKLVVEEAERVLRVAGDLEHNMKLYGSGEAGRISIGLGPLAASLILPRLSQEMLTSRPSLQLSASIKHADHLFQELLGDEIEMIFANSWRIGSSSEVTVTPVGTIRMAMIVRGGHPLAARSKVPLSDLQSFPVANSVALPVMGLTGEAGAFVCDNYHILRETVLGTDCIWPASPDLLYDDIAANRLKQLDVEDFGPVLNEVSMIQRRGRTMSPVAQAIAQTVQEICWQG